MLRVVLLGLLQVISISFGEHHGGRVVCYYAVWAGQRRPPYAVFPRDLPPDLCTHIIFSAAVPSLETGIAPADPPRLSLNGYREAVALKSQSKNGLQVLLSLEAIKEGAMSLSILLRDSQFRIALARGAVALLRALKMDGLDINWQFPELGSQDSENLVSFLQDLRNEINYETSISGLKPLLLTLSVPPIKDLAHRFTLKSLNEYVDWFNVLAMDYHSSNEKETAHPSALYPLPGDTANAHLNVDTTVKFYLSEGVENEKIVVGIPLYGRTFLLKNAHQTHLGASVNTTSRRQQIKETVALYELCRFVEKGGGWTTERPNATAMGPYSFYADVWVAYDDIDIVTRKAEYVKTHGLGGLAFWTVDQDDVLGECGPRYATVAAAAAALAEPITSPYVSLSPPLGTSTEPSWQENSVSPSEETFVNPILVGKGLRPAIPDENMDQPSANEVPQTLGPSSPSVELPPFTHIPDYLPQPTPTQGYDPQSTAGPKQNISEEHTPATSSITTLTEDSIPTQHTYTKYAPDAPNIPFVFESAPEEISEAPLASKPAKEGIPYNPDHLWGPRENISEPNPQLPAGNNVFPTNNLVPNKNDSNEYVPPVEGNIPFNPDHLWGPRENISSSENTITSEQTDSSKPVLSSTSHQHNMLTNDTLNQMDNPLGPKDNNEVKPPYGNIPYNPDHLWGPRKNISISESDGSDNSEIPNVPPVTESEAAASSHKPIRGNTVYSGTRKPVRTTDSSREPDEPFNVIFRNPEQPKKQQEDDQPQWISALNKVLSQIPITFNGTLRSPGNTKSDFDVVSLIEPWKPGTTDLDSTEDHWDAKGEASSSNQFSETDGSISGEFPDLTVFSTPQGKVILNNSRDVYLQTVHIHVNNHFYYNTSDDIPVN